MLVEMTNNPVSMGIIQICPCFDKKSHID